MLRKPAEGCAAPLLRTEILAFPDDLTITELDHIDHHQTPCIFFTQGFGNPKIIFANNCADLQKLAIGVFLSKREDVLTSFGGPPILRLIQYRIVPVDPMSRLKVVATQAGNKFLDGSFIDCEFKVFIICCDIVHVGRPSLGIRRLISS